MDKKCVLIGVFVKKDKILSFLEFLKRRFNINIEKVFVYEIETNDNEYIVTFKAIDKEVYLKNIKHATVLHVKNGCLFSINALNKLINSISDNTPNKEYVVNWNNYKDKLIILTNGELKINNLSKIEDKSVLF